jgi:transposase-like protein
VTEHKGILRDVLQKGSECCLVQMRWPGGAAVCPRCDCERVWRLAHRPGWWQCKGCHRNFTITTSTIFPSSKLSAEKLTAAAKEIFDANTEVPIRDLARRVGLSKQTAWRVRMIFSVGAATISEDVLEGGSAEEVLEALLRLPTNKVREVRAALKEAGIG